jgi:hypothetical protein
VAWKSKEKIEDEDMGAGENEYDPQMEIDEGDLWSHESSPR